MPKAPVAPQANNKNEAQQSEAIVNVQKTPTFRTVEQILNQSEEGFLGAYIGQQLISINQPSQGSDFNFQVPAGYYYRIKTVNGMLVCDSIGGNRTVQFQIFKNQNSQPTFQTSNTTTQSPGSSGGTLAIDGSAQISKGTVSSATVKLTTLNSNDIIIVAAEMNGAITHTLQITDASGLTWNSIAITNNSGGPLVAACWWALATDPLSADQITVSPDSGSFNISINAFGIAGANTITPLDTNVLATATATGTSTAPTVNITTNNANDMILGFVFTSGKPSITAGAGYTLITSTQGSGSNGETGSEDKIVAATQAAVAVNATLGGSNPWIMICTAIQQATSSQTTIQTYFGVNDYPIAFDSSFVLMTLRLWIPNLILAQYDSFNSFTNGLDSGDQWQNLNAVCDVWQILTRETLPQKS